METWFWVLGWFLSILAITGNGFIIFLVCIKRQLHTKTNAFVVSLAVADFSVGMSAVPSLFFYTDHATSGLNSQPRLPVGIEFVGWLFMDASVTNLCSLVLDRYLAVVKPFKYLVFMTRARVIQMIFFPWAIAFGFILLESSLFFSLKEPVVFTVFLWIVIIFFKFLPSLMLVLCFAPMLRVVQKHHREGRALAKQLRFNHRVSFKTHEKSAVVMMGIVIGLFLVTCAVYLRCGFVMLLNNIDSCNDLEYKLPILVSNSAINPLVYAFLKSDIKKEFKRMYNRILRINNRVEPFSLHVTKTAVK